MAVLQCFGGGIAPQPGPECHPRWRSGAGSQNRCEAHNRALVCSLALQQGTKHNSGTAGAALRAIRSIPRSAVSTSPVPPSPTRCGLFQVGHVEHLAVQTDGAEARVLFKISTTFCAYSTSSADGVKASLITSDWPG